MDIDQNKDDFIDNHVDKEIISCLNFNNPKSFFLFAGAGSGKTRSLVFALNQIRKLYYQHLRFRGQSVAVITYTNAACDEIGRRLDYDPLFSVSTIHTFIWELIRGFDTDIRDWLCTSLKTQIEELKIKQENGRFGTKIFIERQLSIETKEIRLRNIDKVKQFTYNPSGLNQDRSSLSHTEVINIGAYFINNKPLMQKILINKYPILFIDESQDTNKDLIDALFEVEKKNTGVFLLGLFGDTMQRIYSDGKLDLGLNLPEIWEKPIKIMNHRCAPRIVEVLNRIRYIVDGQQQRARTDKEFGFARFFVFPLNTDKAKAEKMVEDRMSEITGDKQWSGTDADYTTLILEHHMAANRLGFLEFFRPLYQMDNLKTGLLDGSLPELTFFTQVILPIVQANKNGDEFAITNTVRKYSPLLKIQKNETEQLLKIKEAKESINQFLSLWSEDNNPRCVDVLKCVKELNLFDIPESLHPFTIDINENDQDNEGNPSDFHENDLISAWSECLNAPFSQISAYDSYVKGKLKFMTHQGVKGLEFPRVMVIIDDNEARGFLFSYDKLFGAKERTRADIENEAAGKDTSIERTRRLFYVTCSRAEKSLAITAYSENPKLVKKHLLEEEWFEDFEVEIFL
ncbi:DNA helicase-2/ATP-dependent DNA helicase PcrA [Fontibacillus phaseoli]|uniref:DNA helicase-2/ATP-dependent DNA helicase PcrA n=1 Tax=Fontibacillus phaseoli TaxID=1416533 RepID=A0A369BNZ9_9BACL|nr:UvrD-helicase domain-containing protein [Fontibacillus phaseoli]RCX23332.1 DNA helicase-2/ATP-dependent DNA helicase PcrA [Fontibacillus phaseoli]